jgi:hypothetical protein
MNLRASKYADFGSIRELIKRRFPSILPLRNLDPLLLSDDVLPQLLEGLGDKFDTDDITKWYLWWTSRPDYRAVQRVGGAAYDCFGFCGWQGPQGE